jgi:HEAT repeat protein
MSTKRRILWIAAILVLVVAGCFLFGHNCEPRYNGKSVSYWFREYYSPDRTTESDSDSHQDAVTAMRMMGSNALPYLVHVAFSTNEDSPVRTNFYNLLAKLPDSWNLPQLITKDEIRNSALYAIREIGPSASDILPLMQTELNQSNTYQHLAAICMLTCVSNEFELAVPYLARSLHDPDSRVQNLAFEGLADFGPKASLAVPDLMTVFSEALPGDHSCREAEWVLGMVGSNAAPAIPLLKEAFEKDPDWRMQSFYASSICKIDPSQKFAFDFLIGALTNNPTSDQIESVAFRLASIGPNARFSIPSLINALTNTNCDALATRSVLQAIKALGASDEQILVILQQKLDSDSDKVRQLALDEFGLLDPSGQEAQSALVGLIRKHSQSEMWAVVRLGEMGRAARASIPVLKEERNTTNSRIRALANHALWEIDPKESWRPERSGAEIWQITTNAR